jgi:rubrerythrin
MKKKLFFLAILLCVSSCGNNQSYLTTGGNNTPTTSSELTPTTSEVVDTTPEVTTQQTTTHIHTFEDTLTYDETHHWYAATCGHDDAITKTKHTYEKVVTKPTYEEKGYTVYTCEECGYSYVADETDVLEHSYSSKLTYNETHHWYSCVDEGYEHLKKDEQPHKYKTKVTQPTYENGGYTTYTCEVCSYSYIGHGEFFVHSFQKKELDESTSHSIKEFGM